MPAAHSVERRWIGETSGTKPGRCPPNPALVQPKRFPEPQGDAVSNDKSSDRIVPIAHSELSPHMEFKDMLPSARVS